MRKLKAREHDTFTCRYSMSPKDIRLMASGVCPQCKSTSVGVSDFFTHQDVPIPENVEHIVALNTTKALLDRPIEFNKTYQCRACGAVTILSVPPPRALT
jgi:hypothetical protein